MPGFSRLEVKFFNAQRSVMKKLLLIPGLVFALSAFSQQDTAMVIFEPPPGNLEEEKIPVKVFHSQSLINTKTVEVLSKGVLEFKVSHNFGDLAGSNGGIKRFFGLDNASDIRIGFQLGLTDNLNVVAARAKGAGLVQQLYELGLKYQFMKQEASPGKPLSITAFAHAVVSSMVANAVPGQENSFENFSDRLSETVQLMVARKMGKISLQASAAMVNRNYVMMGDDQTTFAIGGGARLPISEKFILLADYFHPFHNQETRQLYRSMDIELYDVFGVGVEILTQGHVFHLNFTNATETLENRFIPKTITSWGKGQYRWAFTISRNFTLFR